MDTPSPPIAHFLIPWVTVHTRLIAHTRARTHTQAPAGLKPVPRAEWRTSDRITPFKKLLFPFALVALWLLACWQLSLGACVACVLLPLIFPRKTDAFSRRIGQLWMEPMVRVESKSISYRSIVKCRVQLPRKLFFAQLKLCFVS